jgi:hypothetical protein
MKENYPLNILKYSANDARKAKTQSKLIGFKQFTE